MSNERIAIVYHSIDGHTREIAERMAERVVLAGAQADLFATKEAPADLSAYAAVIVGGPMRLGRFHKDLREFIVSHRQQLAAKPNAFFSAGLSAAHDDEAHQQTARDYTEKFLASTGWEPQRVALFGGALLYTHYNFFLRHWMHYITKKTEHEETDISRDYDYTHWEAVAAFADNFVESVLGVPV